MYKNHRFGIQGKMIVDYISGAIMVCSLIKNHYEADNRFEYVTNLWEQLSGKC